VELYIPSIILISYITSAESELHIKVNLKGKNQSS